LFVEKLAKLEKPGKPMGTWEDKIKMGLKELRGGCGPDSAGSGWCSVNPVTSLA
jgi:hypothetical protein